jgi:hypothetical protein
MLQTPTEPIEAPAHDDIEPASPGIGQELIESGTSILRPAHPAIDVLGWDPASRLDVPPEFLQLVLRLLIERRDTG